MARSKLIVLVLTWLSLIGMARPAYASPDLHMCVVEEASPVETLISLARPWSASMCGPYSMPIALAEPNPLSTRAIEAYRTASRLIVEANYDEARLELDLASEGLPRIRDHIALKKARLELLRGRSEQAAEFFEDACDTVLESVRVEASVGRTLALLRADDPDADRALEQLLWEYPSVPGRPELLYEHAKSLTRQGRNQEGAAALHTIRIEHPGSHVGPRVTADLERLATLGVAVPQLSDEERVEIAERLVQTGPLDRAKAEVDALLRRELTPAQNAKIRYLAGRLARNEGRWQAAETYLRTARELPEIDPARAIEIGDRAEDMARTASAKERGAALFAIERMRAGRRLTAVPSTLLRDIIEIASAASLREQVDDALVALAGWQGVPTATLFDATMAAVGTGSEGLVIVLLSRIVDRANARYRPGALYHLGRAHERAGRPETARGFYEQTAAAGDPYYALWAINGLERLDSNDHVESPEGFAELARQALPRAPQTTDSELAEALEPVAEEHGDAYPWIGRAADLLRIGERSAAAEELFEAYLHWRHALGKPVARAGLDSVARADNRVQTENGPAVVDALLELSETDRATLSSTAAALGDSGTAGGFAGPSYIEALPRAYEWLVVPAANRYGLDPNLLLAVMRVESAYQRHIVSYAGAVGLMQIMPRTGQLIAHALGHEDFTPADLLDPKTNLEFAAWYLTSLIRRFDGRLPLAIAAYNGGPHNVRQWLQKSSADASVDVLLERIPFSQTHRYVRRVLVHYDAYRRQQALTVPKLSTKLPAPRVDPLSF